MRHMKAGAGALLVLFIAGAVASPAPTQEAKKPVAVGAVDSAAKSIPGYDGKASAVADDGEFLRRAMLDLVGYPPNLQQVKAFIAEASPNKRVQKISDLWIPTNGRICGRASSRRSISATTMKW